MFLARGWFTKRAPYAQLSSRSKEIVIAERDL